VCVCVCERVSEWVSEWVSVCEWVSERERERERERESEWDNLLCCRSELSLLYGSFCFQAAYCQGLYLSEWDSFVGFDALEGAEHLPSPPPALRDIVTEGNENFERAESENYCYENLKVKYDTSTPGNPIKCKISSGLAVYETSVLNVKVLWTYNSSFSEFPFYYGIIYFFVFICN
jgi:hypothetical protein